MGKKHGNKKWGGDDAAVNEAEQTIGLAAKLEGLVGNSEKALGKLHEKGKGLVEARTKEFQGFIDNKKAIIGDAVSNLTTQGAQQPPDAIGGRRYKTRRTQKSKKSKRSSSKRSKKNKKSSKSKKSKRFSRRMRK